MRHLDDIDGIWSLLKRENFTFVSTNGLKLILIEGSNDPAEYFFPGQILYLICYLSRRGEEAVFRELIGNLMGATAEHPVRPPPANNTLHQQPPPQKKTGVKRH